MFGPGLVLSPLRIALFGAAATYAVLYRRWQSPLLRTLSAACGLTALMGATPWEIMKRCVSVVRPVWRSLPKTALGWGGVGVVASFVLLAAGARRSLRGVSDGGETTGPEAC